MKRVRHLIAGLSGAATLAAAPLAAQQSPADLSGELFRSVQLGRVFTDGKTLVDAVPKRAPDATMADYRRSPPRDASAPRTFVLTNFIVPGVNDCDAAALGRHIRSLWPMLVRQPEAVAPGSSALPMEAPYVVPGGRFREIHYWDSYFTMLGLAADGQQPVIESMLADFVASIERYCHVPNGMRSYYLGRSQPPFFALMLDLSRNTDPGVAARRLTALKAEHAYWKGSDCLDPTGACARVVRRPDDTLLNRYWDDRPLPRDESYAEDVTTAAEDRSRSAETVYRHLRAGAESGWDYNSRWLADLQRLSAIRTGDIVPVDLNALMFAMEQAIARRCAAAADKACDDRYEGRASRRRAAIDRFLWVPDEGRYADWDRVARRPTPRVSAAMLYPLFAGAASPTQAAAVATTVRHALLASGGFSTTPLQTGQQWDSPNGWAPLQWIAIEGLARSGQPELARDIADRWLTNVSATWADTGKMLEKYDLEERKPGGEGEYLTAARAAVGRAKVAFGKRGPVWWRDRAPDFNRRMVVGTPYEDWFEQLETT